MSGAFEACIRTIFEENTDSKGCSAWAGATADSFTCMQFSDIRALQELVGHYDAMTLQGGTGVAVTGEPAPEKAFLGSQYFKTEEAEHGARGGENVLPIGAWYCSDIADAAECEKVAIDANNWRFAA